MSLKRLLRAVNSTHLDSADRKWFPRWVSWYAEQQGMESAEAFELDREKIITFLRHLRDSGKPAWQRMQAVRAIEFYRTNVLRSQSPELADIRERLALIAATEGQSQPDGDQTRGEIREADVGQLDPNEAETLRAVRRQLRLEHYSLRTEKAYVGWIERFLARFQLHDLAALAGVGEPEIKEFLSELAIEGRVSASTQNQAFSALLYLFQTVLHREL